ncbi:hypothetical protein TcWFU_001456 [Taenia crassiceps]|uniref:Uncharacterized protein n=1 Tax=Taenia crassiceps TaxID=6207 RepID=A0ABR4Q6F5_9CEST
MSDWAGSAPPPESNHSVQPGLNRKAGTRLLRIGYRMSNSTTFFVLLPFQGRYWITNSRIHYSFWLCFNCVLLSHIGAVALVF